MILFKNAKIFAPQPLPQQEVLVGGGRILVVGDGLSLTGVPVETVDLEGRYLVPGFIDEHVHIIGGGGLFGPTSYIPEISMEELLSVGTTTVMGVLGTDGFVKNLPVLYNKARALTLSGMTAYMLTSYYGIPEQTLTGSVMEDMIFIDRVIGCKLAISDDRSAFPTRQEILRLLHEVRIGGAASGKHGILHIHLGNLESKIDVLLSIIEEFPTLTSYLSPTHCIRTVPLFEQCVEFAKKGGFIDISTGGTKFTDPHQAVGLALEKGVPLANMAFSSDGRGGVKRVDPETGAISYTPAPVHRNHLEMTLLVKNGILPLGDALTLLTSNPARNLSLPQKGRIAVGADADLVVLNDDLSIGAVYAMGKKYVG